MPGDLLRFEQAADASEVRLQDRRSAGGEDAQELVLRRQALAGSDRDRRRARDLRHLLRAVGRNRLLEPERVVALEPTREPDRTGRRELAVRADEQVAPVPDGLADTGDVRLRPRERLEARLSRVERGVRAEPGRTSAR